MGTPLVSTNIASGLRETFRDIYGGAARLYRAPGRINLIGEHTDYNDGFVMPVAIDLYVWVAIAPRNDRKLVVRSVNFPGEVTIDIEENDAQARRHWSDYIQGVAVMLLRAGHHLQGANILIRGDVPVGAGLSSSAAIEVATALALLEGSGGRVDRVELAKLCQRAENEFVGARVGIMDQFVSSCGQAGQTLLLDCRSLQYRLLPLPRGVSLVICNTMVKHEHSSSGYNQRRAECEEGVRLLRGWLPQVRALRDVTEQDLARHAAELPATIRKRCRHVVRENARVCDAVTEMENGNLSAFGRLMQESHQSLRNNYEVSCPELDLMVELAGKQEGLYGARMMGGGFGGCTVNLVRSGAAAKFGDKVASAYENATGIAPEIFVTSAADGASEVQ